MTIRFRSLAGLLLVGLSLWPAAGARAFSFTKVTDPGNPIVTDPGADNQKYYGTSWIDYDGDGDIDLYRDPTFLYRNDGGGAFTKITTSGIGSQSVTTQPFSMEGNSWADTDNDGDPDVFLSGEVGVFYRNTGGQFTPVLSGGIGDISGNRGWACAWGDYDNDGLVDLVVTHPRGFIPGPPLPNHFFHNDGPPGYNFTPVQGEPITDGLAPYTIATWADYDDDGDQDLFIGAGPVNGTVAPDYLYRNLLTETGQAHFERILDPPIGTDPQDGQVWNWIDYDNDGDLDAYLTNYVGTTSGMPNRLYRHETDGSFTAITGQTIVTDADPDLASVWADFDNDGDLDCFVATDGPRADHLYQNNGDGTFSSVVGTPLTATAFPTRGATAGDYDNDGDVDLYVYGPSGNPSLYRNDVTGMHWLSIRLVGSSSNRSAIGARVRVKATLGGVPVWQRRDVSAQNTFQGQNDLRAHFGLRDAAQVDSLEIRWPGGIVQVLTGVAANQFLTVTEPGSARVGDGHASGERGAILECLPQPSSADVWLRLRIPGGPEGGFLAIHDASGRELRVLPVGRGQTAVRWDGLDAAGRKVAAGVYPVRLRSDGIELSTTLIRVR
jgi:hypothetical protein